MGKKALQWHPAFQAALQVELAQDRPFLRFYEEYNLSRKPLQMDTLIVKLEPGHAVSKSIGRIFRTYNIVEYKSPEDYISVNDFYKVLGYVCVYQADTRKVLEIVPEELTITLVGDHYPGRLVRHLKKRYGVRVRNVHKGIYYIEDFIFPVQLLVTGQLPKEEYAWLGRLRKGLDLKLVQHCVNSCDTALAICARCTPTKLAVGSTTPSLRGRTSDADIKHCITVIYTMLY